MEELTIDQMNLFKTKAPGKRKKSNFNPDREFIQAAIDEYLKNGGKIKKISAVNSTVRFVNHGGRYVSSVSVIPNRIPNSIF
jgi:hypothetical protein